MTIKKTTFSAIYLNCRRGMLELDLILLNFLEKHYNNLNAKLKKEFILLLHESDNILYSLLIKNMYNKKYQNIINTIKNNNNFTKFN